MRGESATNSVEGSASPTSLPTITVYGTNAGGGLDLNKPVATGSRLGVPVRELPMSVDVIDREKMDEWGARTLLEAVELAPGITGAEPVSTPGVFSSRGFIGNDVLSLYDGLAFGPSTMVGHPEDTWKYSRIEVLKGPASLLYGEGALAGVVNFIPKAPNTDRVEHEVFTSYGSFNTSRLGVGSGGPIADTGLSYRLDFSRQSSDGFVDGTGQELYDMAGALRYDVSEQFSVTFSFDVLWQDFGSYWGTPLVNGQVESGTREVNYNIWDSITDIESQWFRLDADWRPSETVQVRNMLYGYLADRHWRNVERYSYMSDSETVRRSSPVEILHDQTVAGDRLDAAFTQELFGRENRFLAGVEGSVDDFQRDSNRPDSGLDYVDLYAPARGLFEDVRTVATTEERSTRTTTGALLMEDQFRLLNQFSLIGGVRGELIDVDSENLRGDPASNKFSQTYTPVTGRIGGVFEAVTNLSVYAMYSTAAKAPSVLVVLDENYRDFDLEQGEMVEVGVKHSLWESRLEWTLALYQIWKEDIVTRDPADAMRNLQIGEQSSHGVELSLALRPTWAWTVGGNVAVLDSSYDEFNVASGSTVLSYAGNTPPNVPETVANLWTSYRLPWNIEVGALARYVGRVQANNANTMQLPEYATVDLYARYRYKQAELGLRVRNVFDNEYSAWSVGDGAQVLLGAPLSVEVSFRYRF